MPLSAMKPWIMLVGLTYDELSQKKALTVEVLARQPKEFQKNRYTY